MITNSNPKSEAIGPQPARWRTSTPLSAPQLADLAVEALIAEAMLTPKPGLVDQRGSGAHRDLDLMSLLRSARSLHETFRRMADLATGRRPDQSLREELALIGRAGETAMFAATGGSNAHRGAIWVIGLLVAARAMCGEDAPPGEVAVLAARVGRFADRLSPRQESHGLLACMQYGVSGARGQAYAGFPHVVDVGLPALLAARKRGVSERCAQLDALMAIMSSLDDTCLLHRGGLVALLAARSGARKVLTAGGSASTAGWAALLMLDAQLLALNASPGGCADLLAACLFLDRSHLSLPVSRDSHAGESHGKNRI
jgi:triphosphoribosyl-dephospho-CoA synthase